MKLSKKFNLSIQKRELEFLPALYILVWGLWVSNPWLNTFQASPTFTEMGHLAPEWVWGLVISAVGLFQMIIIFTKKYGFRVFAALLSMFVLFAMSLLVFYSNPASTAWVTYLVIAICAWLGFTEILTDFKKGGEHGNK